MRAGGRRYFLDVSDRGSLRGMRLGRMVIGMAADASAADVKAIVDRVESAGGEAFVSRGVSSTIIGLVGDISLFGTLNLETMPGVRRAVRVSAKFKLVSLEHRPKRS